MFYAIENITDARSCRVIVYYIQCKSYSSNGYETTLYKNTEILLEKLNKKNDDLILIKILVESDHFKLFDNIYKPYIKAPITLFVVNNEGIPLLAEPIHKECDIFQSVKNISKTCKLNSVHENSLGLCTPKTEPLTACVEKSNSSTSEELNVSSYSFEACSTTATSNSENVAAKVPTSVTRLHIRLPDGNVEEKQFDNDSLLQEVWIVIKTQYNVPNFDLKTYNHPIFTEQDYTKTLQDLNLCPNSSVIVVIKNTSPLSNNSVVPSIIMHFISRFYRYSSFAFQYTQGLFILFWNYIVQTTRPRGSSSDRQRHNSGSSSSNSDHIRPSTNKSRRNVSKHIGNNIHTLVRNEDSDDEQNRYNGNSTQQQ